MRVQKIASYTMAALWCVFLTQCSSFVREPGRAGKLKSIGYVPVRLDKIGGDSRYSGAFEVNGQSLRLLVDSGANSTDVTENYANEVGLKRDHSVSVISRGALGRSIKSGYGKGQLKIGPVYARDFPFSIGPEPEKQTATSRYAGQIGLDALMASGSLIDLSRGAMWVPSHSRPFKSYRRDPQLGPQAGLGLHALPLHSAKGFPHLILEGRVNGDRMTWVVDTGAEASVLSEVSFRKLNLQSHPSNVRILDAVGDRIRVREAVLYDVEFPGVLVKQFNIVVAPLKDVRRVFKDQHGRPVDGILGMDFLVQGQALLDPGSRLLYIGRPGR